MADFKSIDIMDYDSIIFDADHTLIRYNLHPLFELIYDSLRQFLVEVRLIRLLFEHI